MVTNARSPGSKCYGLVAMSTGTEVTRCISHLDCTELHGQEIFVERVSRRWEYRQCSFHSKPSYLVDVLSVFHIRLQQFSFKAKNDPFKKEGPKKEAEDKSSEKRTSTGTRLTK